MFATVTQTKLMYPMLSARMVFAAAVVHMGSAACGIDRETNHGTNRGTNRRQRYRTATSAYTLRACLLVVLQHALVIDTNPLVIGCRTSIHLAAATGPSPIT
jgi:hypothetical protein